MYLVFSNILSPRIAEVINFFLLLKSQHSQLEGIILLTKRMNDEDIKKGGFLCEVMENKICFICFLYVY